MMIRTYKLKRRPPVKRILSLTGEITHNWLQQVDLPDDVRDYFLSEVPHFKTLRPPSIVLHTTWESIAGHRDRMSKSSFVFPILFGKTTRFYVEDFEVSFERGKMYRFNDHYLHGVNNENNAYLVLVTVSYLTDY